MIIGLAATDGCADGYRRTDNDYADHSNAFGKGLLVVPEAQDLGLRLADVLG
jgi:hypothetical protein